MESLKEKLFGSSTFMVAELSANHIGSLEHAIATIKAAAEAGADAIKLQTYTADTITIKCDKPPFRIEGGLWDGRFLHDLYQEAYTPWEWHEQLFRAAADSGLICFSSPFDNSAVDLLESLDAPAYKIASFEISDVGLIRYAASKGKPIIISSGIATEADIQLALDTCKEVGNEEVVFLKCTSAYPAPLEEANLRTMVDMRTRFGVPTGLSDHTMGHTVAVAAATLGAVMIEKHFILDRSLGGPDASFSMEPSEFKAMVDEVRRVEKALGTVSYNLSEKQEKSRQFARSLFVVEDIEVGEVLTAVNVRSIRPGYGMHPKHLEEVLGEKAKKKIERG